MFKNILFMLTLLCTTVVFAEQQTIGGVPKNVTTTTVTIEKPNGSVVDIKTASSKLLLVQTTTTVVKRATGQQIVCTNYGHVVGDVTNGKIAQQRIQVTDAILQGNTITINDSGYVVVNEVVTNYTGNINDVYNVTVHSVNGEPTTIQVMDGDVVGSQNRVSYWVNGQDTGVTANMIMYKTLLTEDGVSMRAKTFDKTIVGDLTYYVVDGVQTEIVVKQGDVIRDVYQAIDPVTYNTTIPSTVQQCKVYKNDVLLLTTNNLGYKVVSTLTKNNKTINGYFTKQNITFVKLGNNVFYGRTLVSKDGYIYIDGVNTNIAYNNPEVVIEKKLTYIVDGNITDVYVEDQDVVNQTIYYTDNGVLTNIIKQQMDNIVVEDVQLNDKKTWINNKQYTIIANEQSYIATQLEKFVGKKIIVNGKNYYGKQINLKAQQYLYYNNNVLGKKSNGEFYNIQRAHSDNLAIFQVNDYNSVGFLQDTNENYYLSQFNSKHYIASGKIYSSENSSISRSSGNSLVTINGYTNDDTYIAKKLQSCSFLFQKKGTSIFTLVGSYNYNNTTDCVGGTNLTAARSARYNNVTANDFNIFLPAISVISANRSHCAWCYNQTSPGAYLSADGYPNGSGNGLAVTTAGTLKGGEGHFSYTFNSSTNNKQVRLIGPSVNKKNYSCYLGLKNNGKCVIFKYNGTYTRAPSEHPIVQINDAIQISSDRKNNAYAISKNKLYKITVNDDSMDRSGTPVYSFKQYNSNYNLKKLCVANNNVAVLTQDNKILFLSNEQLKQVENVSGVQDLGTFNDKIVYVVPNTTEFYQVPVVKINGVQYDMSDIQVKGTYAYNIDDKYYIDGSTQYDIIEAELVRLKLTNGKEVIVENNQVDNYLYKDILTNDQGNVLAIIDTSQDGYYVVNGNKTDVEVNINDMLTIDVVKTYYIGDVDTSIPCQQNDLVQINGDYWIVNGFNTQVKSYGLGQMCIKVSDTSPGQYDEQTDSNVQNVVVPLLIRCQIVRFDEKKPITEIRLQYRKLNDNNWTNLKVLTNQKRKLQTKRLQAVFGRYVNVPVSKQQSFILRCNITDGTTSTVTASSLQIQKGNIFYWAFIRSTADRPN